MRHGGPGHGPDGLLELGPAGQGEDRPVVVGVAVHVEQGSPPAAAMAATTTASRPSLTLTTHSSRGGAPTDVTTGTPGVPPGSVAAGLQARDPAPAQDPATLALGGAAPHAVVHPVLEGVLEARGLDRAVGADLLG